MKNKKMKQHRPRISIDDMKILMEALAVYASCTGYKPNVQVALYMRESWRRKFKL